MSRGVRCHRVVPHAAFLIEGRCAACERHEQLARISRKQHQRLYDAIASSWMASIERDLDLMVRFDAYLAQRDLGGER